MAEMTPEAAQSLRRPFPQSAVGILPKPYKKDSPKGQCKECGQYHGLPAVHLDYVGHAATTDRLLAVDPAWTWEPMGTDSNGLPVLDPNGNLWIRLTVCGVTRIGVGDGLTAKEAIGDAIRNAAMRFGVALDLWSKEELEQSHSETKAEPASPRPEREAPPIRQLQAQVWNRSREKDPDLTDDDRRMWIAGELAKLGGDRDNPDTLHQLLKEWT